MGVGLYAKHWAQVFSLGGLTILKVKLSPSLMLGGKVQVLAKAKTCW